MKKIFLLLLLFTCLETISQTYGLRYGDKDIAAIVYLVSGVFIGVLPLPYSYLFYTSTFLSLLILGQYAYFHKNKLIY